MEFKLKTTDTSYCKEDMEKLKELGFVFERYRERGYEDKFFKKYTSPKIKINSLKQLMALVERCGGIIVLTKDTIEIYDNYRE